MKYNEKKGAEMSNLRIPVDGKNLEPIYFAGGGAKTYDGEQKRNSAGQLLWNVKCYLAGAGCEAYVTVPGEASPLQELAEHGKIKFTNLMASMGTMSGRKYWALSADGVQNA